VVFHCFLSAVGGKREDLRGESGIRYARCEMEPILEQQKERSWIAFE
jgi:hypothetical protein